MIELGVELHLVLFASGHEQHVGVLGGQQRLDGVLTPALAPIRLRLAPPGIGPVPDIPVISTRRTGRAYAGVTRQHPARILISGTAHSA